MERTREQQKEILLVPLGKVLTDVLEEIAVALRKTYRLHVRIGRSEEPDTSAYSDERRQFDADKLLQLMAVRKRDMLAVVLGIVDADMFSGEKTFVFGVNSSERGVAVEALARLREEFYKKPPKRELFLRRAVTEAIYQAGLAFGLPACTRQKCALLPTTSLWKLDEKGQNFCAESQRLLDDKLQPKRREEAPAASLDAKVTEALIEEEELEQMPAGEAVVAETPPEQASASEGETGPYDESQMPAEEVEPEVPPAEETAMHVETEGADEPLDADKA